MTRKQLARVIKFMFRFDSDVDIKEVNEEYGLHLTDATTKEEALTSYLDKENIQLERG